jgi:hypothetical protein
VTGAFVDVEVEVEVEVDGAVSAPTDVDVDDADPPPGPHATIVSGAHPHAVMIVSRRAQLANDHPIATP